MNNSVSCISNAVRIFIDIGRIPLPMAKQKHPPSQPKYLLPPYQSVATYDQWVAAWKLNFLPFIECAAHRTHPERQLTKGPIYESSNVDAHNIGSRTLRSSALHVAGSTQSVSPGRIFRTREPTSVPGLQPLPAWDSPG
jgi:hypothetical protein